MEKLTQLPPDMVFFTQITMEAAEDPGSSKRCVARTSRRPGRVEAVTRKVSRSYKGSTRSAKGWSAPAHVPGAWRYVLGSFIWTAQRSAVAFEATADIAQRAGWRSRSS